MKRYTAKADGCGRVVLTVHVDCDLGDAGSERSFYCRMGGGYVSEDGRQVCDMLALSGPTLRAPAGGLLATIRAEAARCLADQKRREARE